MLIVLFRHGPAGKRDPDRWPDDDLRPLTSRGRERTRLAAQGLHRQLPPKPHVWTSPLVRTAQTAELFAEVCGAVTKVEPLDELRPESTPRALIRKLGTLGERDTVVLIGHEPDLGRLAGVLLVGTPVALPLKKAGACSIRFQGPIKPGAGHLEWLVPPRMLRRRGRSKSKSS
jgi:phosphohistidine phosphatase